MGQVSAALRGWVDGALDEAAVGARQAADPKAEVALLTSRATTFERLGNWAEAATLREASLLLDPGHFDARVGVIRALTRQLAQLSARAFQAHRQSRDHALVASVRAAQLSGLDHLEALVTRADTFRTFTARGTGGADIDFLQELTFFAGLPGGGRTAEETDLHGERGAALLRIMPRIAPKDHPSDMIYVEAAVAGLPPPEKYAWVERLILGTASLPGAQARTTRYIGYARRAQRTPGDEFGAFATLLARLDASGSAEVRAAVADVRRQEAARPKTPAPSPKLVWQGVGDLGLRPLRLVQADDGRPVDPPTGIVSAGPGVDVVWGRGTVYVMKAKGQVRPVWSAPGATLIQGAVYDGRYVWAVAHPPQEWPRVLVIDPTAGTVWSATPPDGLPEGDPRAVKGPASYQIKVAPIGPGRACVVGSFGQTWVGVAALDSGAGRVAVKVIHEAREAQVQNDATQLARTTVDFVPQFVHTIRGRLRDDGGAETRVLIGRGWPLPGNGTMNSGLVGRPLVVDPDRGSVAVLRDFSSLPAGLRGGDWVAAADGTAYGVRPTALLPGPHSWEFARMTADDLTWKSVGPARSVALTEQSFATVVAARVHADRFHYILHVTGPDPDAPGSPNTRYEFWSVALDGTGARRSLPNVTRGLIPNSGLHTSSHYGVVVSGGDAGLYPILTRDPN
ncbi:hypothetical protein J0H58_22175 [bacterium]|nr:hypothetical protein [bacterium]